MKTEATPSPNYDARQLPVDALVLHYTGMETGAAALARMCDEAAKVSAHYMVWEDGRVVQLVDEDKRAWHAGVSYWAGETDMNSCSVGIEIVNGGHDFLNEDGALPPYPEAQIEAVMALCKEIIARHDIPGTRILGHSDIAPARKIDPGEHFPWARLAAAGIGLWSGDLHVEDDGETLLSGDTGAPVRMMQDALSKIGYGIEVSGLFDETTRAALTAFQRRFVPETVTGWGNGATRTALDAVTRLYVPA